MQGEFEDYYTKTNIMKLYSVNLLTDILLHGDKTLCGKIVIFVPNHNSVTWITPCDYITFISKRHFQIRASINFNYSFQQLSKSIQLMTPACAYIISETDNVHT